MGCQGHADEASRKRQMRDLNPVPLAAAGSEWIKDEQRNELSEALAEFSFRRLSSFRFREPCHAGQGFGGPLFAYFIWASK